MKNTLRATFYLIFFLVLAAFSNLSDAALCTDPPPYDNTSFPLSPAMPVAGTVITYWEVDAKIQVDSYTVTTSGNTVNLTYYLTSLGTALPGSPTECIPMVLGAFNAGTYQLNVKYYARRLGNAYPAVPQSGIIAFTVLPLTNVPLSNGLIGILFLLLNLSVTHFKRPL
jgi:hypothetical protein